MGVFITRGMGVRIPAGGLVIGTGPDGKNSASIRLQVALDMCPYWLEIAVEHLRVASSARAEVLAAQAIGEEAAMGSALEQEFSAGMQALTSAAIAVDALYASVKDRVSVPDALTKAWRAKRTARHAQVAEVFRQTFRMSAKGFEHLREALEQLYKFRDLAVHPPGAFSDPVHHPALKLTTEWRFVSFGLDSAHVAVRAAVAVAVQLAEAPRRKTGPLAEYCVGLSTRLKPLAATWRAEFGRLLDKEVGG